MEISAISYNGAFVKAEKTVGQNISDNVDLVDTTPAAVVDLSADAVVAASSSNTEYSVTATIKATLPKLEEAMEKTQQFYKNYDKGTESDNYNQERDITKIVNNMWLTPNGIHYSVGEWAQHGKVINGRKTVTDGSADVQYGMTALFNDISFNTKKEVANTYSIMKYAYNA